VVQYFDNPEAPGLPRLKALLDSVRPRR